MADAPRRIRPFLSLLLLLATAAACAAHRGPAAPPADLAIVHVDVVDVREGRLLRDHTVLVSGDGITAVFPSGRVAPAAGSTIDGRGAYLIPGLWDMHAHLRANGLPEWVSTEWMMPLLLAHGVTGVRDMNSDCDGPGQGPVCLETMREWQASVEAGELAGPRLLALSSFQVNPPWDFEVTEALARSLVQTLDEKDVDLIKVYHRLSPEAFGWIMEAAAERGLPAAGHVPLRMSAAEASEAGLASVEHARDFLFDCFPGAAAFRASALSLDPPPAAMRRMVDEHDPAACEAVFRILARNGTAYVPTHVTRRADAFAGDSAFRADPRGRWLPPLMRESWLRDAGRMAAADSAGAAADFYRKGLEITGAAHRAGVRVLLGTDGGDTFVFPGSGAHDELGELVAAGLSPAEALRAATLHPAEFLGLAARHGTVEPGKRADLVLLSADPLRDPAAVRGIVGVVFGGRHLDRARLDALLRDAEAAAARPLGPPGGS